MTICNDGNALVNPMLLQMAREYIITKFDTLSTENQVWSAANGAITPPDAPEVGVKYRIDMTSNNIKDQTIFFGAKCKPDQGV
ncbi:hypothetical protein OUZ56_009987 [Daphnia magna]|uniref:Uncharacterized protein n=1 Tax=Daphnia magna TaxID=35525 RepID=A0ABR0AHJ7_9CRUS|nr:hypothetical protein OUZ56_009987 [Daphnia magna]